MRRINRSLKALSLLFAGFAILMTACQTAETIPPMYHYVSNPFPEEYTSPPYQFVVNRWSEDGVNWSTPHVHDDLVEDTNSDLAVDPNSGILHMAFFHQKPNNRHYLMVKSSLGANNWSTDHEEIEITDPGQYTQPNFEYLTDRVYLVTWFGHDTVFTALYDIKKPAGTRITAGPQLLDERISGSAQSWHSAIWLNGSVYLAFTSASGDPGSAEKELIIARATLQSGNLSVPTITNTNVPCTSLSELITDGNSLYLVVTQDGAAGTPGNFVALTSTDGMNWQEYSSCPRPASTNFIDRHLSFFNPEGQIECLVIETYNPEGGHNYQLLNLDQCSVKPFSIPYSWQGKFEYFPGRSS